jgi:hypothetical protein
MSRVFNNYELTWRGNDLFVGRSSSPLVTIVPDKIWPGMWRVRDGDRLSDMTNVTRARDAARSLALSLLNTGGRTGLGAPPVEKNDEGLITLSDASFNELLADKPVRPREDRTGLAAVGQVERAKGGRGKRGGISEAARQAGVSRFAAMRAAKPVRAVESAEKGSDGPKPVSVQQTVKKTA